MYGWGMRGIEGKMVASTTTLSVEGVANNDVFMTRSLFEKLLPNLMKRGADKT